jgi:hypothetical protein
VPRRRLMDALSLGAAVVLGFDGAVLVALGAWAGKPLLLVVGVALGVAAALVLVSWRAQRRRLDEIRAARRDLRDEARALADLLRRN